jgi:REP-associated tyrosine transposase
LIASIEKARLQHNFSLWAYVFMPNHVHLIIFPKQNTFSISAILRSIKQPVSRRAIEYLKKENPQGLHYLLTQEKRVPYRFWQAGGGYDRNITVTKTLVKAIKYIHNNPVRKDLVSIATEWTYSSARQWSGEDSVPLSLDLEDFPIN